MDKRENVLTHLRIIRTWARFADERGMMLAGVELKRITEWMDEAIALLNGMEPIDAEITDRDGDLIHWWACGKCNAPINPEDKYCHECGWPVKWGHVREEQRKEG